MHIAITYATMIGEDRVKILFLLKNTNVEKTTVFIETVKALVERNAEVHIVIASQPAGYIAEKYYDVEPNIKMDVLDIASDTQTGVGGLKNFIRKYEWLEKAAWTLVNFVSQWTFRIKNGITGKNKELVFEEFLTPSMRNFIPQKQYDYIWTIDEYGLLWAEWINLHSEIKYKIIHHSVELYWEHYSLPRHEHWQYFKQYALFERARTVLQNVGIIIIQDEERWKALCTFTGLDCKREKFLWPVSMRNYPVNIFDDIYEKMNIDRDKKIIFYPTIITPRRGCVELVRMTQQLDNQFVTVLHGFIALQDYLAKIKEAVSFPDKVIISNTTLDYQQLINMHHDIWCVFLCYGEADSNNKYIVNSSNKLVMALQAGKPIITIGNQTLAELCSEYECGIAVSKWETAEFVSAICELDKKYDLYCKNARKCYEERFNIEPYADEMYNKLLAGI